jgi:hypothetical protein
MGFFWKNCAKATILDNEFMKVTITKWDPKTFLLAWFDKLKKKLKKTRNPMWASIFQNFWTISKIIN